MTNKSEDRDGVMRLSHRLVAMHVAGVAILILVVLLSVVWVSAEHNKLALESSESMVRGGVASFRARVRTLVRDYSIWNEAYDAVNDRRPRLALQQHRQCRRRDRHARRDRVHPPRRRVDLRLARG